MDARGGGGNREKSEARRNVGRKKRKNRRQRQEKGDGAQEGKVLGCVAEVVLFRTPEAERERVLNQCSFALP